ncbi:Lin0512 family protein [uncultured Roseobacter sp.]|uniref:Lin0512 family protein n=1 Tax=uncultured Roseobacter sp. TaxID=114847 RepID=UPI00262422A9|nr:Lin0512 family protein [uncultured Roseobacter sp.]
MEKLLVEFGMGTSLRRGDYTEAAVRGVKDALWHNSINLAELFGFEKTDMQIIVDIGVQHPEKVDVDKVLTVFPYGQADVRLHHGGLDAPRPDGDGNPTIMANVALTVGFDMERKDG